MAIYERSVIFTSQSAEAQAAQLESQVLLSFGVIADDSESSVFISENSIEYGSISTISQQSIGEFNSELFFNSISALPIIILKNYIVWNIGETIYLDNQYSMSD